MADETQLDLLLKGPEAWNLWRKKNPRRKPSLSGADLSDARLGGVNLSNADLSGARLYDANLYEANLRNANLRDADFTKAVLSKAILSDANLKGANFRRANLQQVDLRGANLRGQRLWAANLFRSNLSGADLTGADLRHADLRRTDLRGANLSGADLSTAILVNTNLIKANLTGCSVYGISAWGVELDGARQKDLIITQSAEPVVKVDNLEVAQFIYLLLNNKKIRDVINTVGQKTVLILGRFTAERKEILDAVADRLREKGFIPIIFDFERSQERDFRETILTLAGLSLFVIADITNPKSSPLELQATVPNYMIPFVPIIQEGEEPFSMFVDLQNTYDWVLSPTIVYGSKKELLEGLEDAVIKPAMLMHDKLINKRAEKMKTKNIKDILKARARR